MNFRQWLKEYKSGLNEYSQLAQELYNDKNLPFDGQHQEIINYIEREYPHDGFIKLVKSSFKNHSK